MSQERFSIVFRGDLVPGHGLADVKAKLAKLFKTDEAKVEKLFSGSLVPLKSNLDAATAEKYRQVLTAAGAQVAVKSESEADKSEEKRKQLLEKRAAKLEAKKAGKQTLAERLAAQEGSDDGGNSNPFLEGNSPNKVKDPEPDESGLALLPVGVDVLSEEERESARPQVVVVNDLQATLAPEGGDLLQETERKEVTPVVVDTSGLEVTPQAGNLVEHEELFHEDELDIEVPSLDIAETGATLDQEEKLPPPPAPDTSNIHLA